MTETLTRRKFIKAGIYGACAMCLATIPGWPRPSFAQAARKGFINPRPSPWFSDLPGSIIRCTLCPEQCRISPGRRGRCGVRENRDGTGYTLAYGNPALVQIDPVERLPFFHVMPGARILALSTAGCPLKCRFCEVWDMALATPEEVHAYDLPPDRIIAHAGSADVRGISFAFGEPVAFFEYMSDIAALAKKEGLMNLAHTSGYISPEPLRTIMDKLDAFNIDLKGFCPDFYRKMTGAEIEPVKNTLMMLKRAGIHIEITNLVIPGANDDLGGIKKMCDWIAEELGTGVPIHFARFYPLYRLANLPPTPVATLDQVRATALESGLEHVYVARVTGHEGENTFCPGCGKKIIDRLGFVIEAIHLERGRCRFCDTPIAGRWE